jgi:acylphosphatase
MLSIKEERVMKALMRMAALAVLACAMAWPACASPAQKAGDSAPAVRAAHVFVSGKVQSVGFRDWTVAQASDLKLTGWVRNLTDKRVEAVLEGPAEAVAAMIEKMKKGPSTARVDDLKTADQTPSGKYKSFERLPDAAPPQ